MWSFRQCILLFWIMVGLGAGLSEAMGAEEAKTSEPPDVIETPELFISATKTETPIKHVTSAVEIITGEQMQQRRMKTVVEALRLAQGLAVFQSGGPGTLAQVRMRGGTPQQTLVLIDGAIVNSATDGTYNFANLTTDNIERIEILRGSQGMMWGSDAMGGVVNIITKRGRETPNISAFAEYGSFATLREGASVTGKKGLFDVAATLSRWDTSNFSAINYRRGAAERDGFHNWQGSMKLGVDLPKDGRLEFNFRWMDGITNLDGTTFNPVTSGFDPADVLGAKTHSKEYVYTGSYLQPITKWWSQRLSLARATNSFSTNSGTIERNVVTGAEAPPFPLSSEINTVSNRLEWQHDFQIVKPLFVTAGYQFREGLGENLDTLTATPTLTQKVISSNAGFAEAKLNLWDRLFGTAGIRQDEYNVFGSATTYRVTGGYLLKETGTKLRGSYGTGFRAPTINDLFFPGFGNPNLQPEKSRSSDVALEQSLFDERVFVSAGYFWTRYQNLILSVFDPGGVCSFSLFGFCAANIGEARAEGVEASTKLKLIRDQPWIKSLDLQFQYTHTSTRNQTNGGNTRLPLWPLNQWSAVLSYQPIEALRANLEGRFVGQRFNDTQNDDSLPHFYVWNASFTYDVTKTVQVYGRADNIFNRKYEEVLFFGTPIRSVFGGVRVNFDVPL
jgi:vitamin B12 transporter